MTQNNNQPKINYVPACLLTIFAIILDQWTKHLAVTKLQGKTPFILINKVFQLCYLENRGAAFGLLQNQRIFFLICALVILIFAIWIYGKLPNAQRYLPLRICIIGICAGAIGNMIDRIYLGYVVDFFYFNLIDFPIFNVADIYVTVSTIVLVILILFYYQRTNLKNCFIVENEEGKRIDRYLAEQMPDMSRSYIQKIIKDGLVTVSEKPVKANYRLSLYESIKVTIPELKEPEIEAEDIPLDILYEDQDIIVINKPKGMVVHPAPGHYSGTLVNALMYHCGNELSGINGVMRPGIVHRIDMDTTGSLIICKNDMAHQCIAEQLKEHSIKRVYYAIVHGNIKEDHGTVNAAIGRHPIDRKKMSTKCKQGKHAVTHYTVIERFEIIPLFNVSLKQEEHIRSVSIWQVLTSVIR